MKFDDIDDRKNISSHSNRFNRSFLLPQNLIATKVLKNVFNEHALTCKDVLKNISAFYDGELDFKNYYLIEKHIKSCAKCRLKYNDLMKTSMLIKSAYLSGNNKD
jgi:DNA-binding FrmR family transcriptional regulator